MKATQIATKIRQITNAERQEREAAAAKQAALEAAMIREARQNITDKALYGLIAVADMAKYLGEYLIANLCMGLVLQTLSEVGSKAFELVLEDTDYSYYDLLAVRTVDRELPRYLCIPWPLLAMESTKFATTDDSAYLCHCDMSCYESRYTGCKQRLQWKADPAKLMVAFGVACHTVEKEVHNRKQFDYEGDVLADQIKRLHDHMGYFINELVSAKIKVGSAPQWLVETNSNDEEPLRKPAFDLLVKIMADFKVVNG